MNHRHTITVIALLGISLAAQAANILWVSDNGPELNAPNGVFYPPVSTGTPYTDQGFVDLLINAGHTVTRYNPNSNGFRDSQADIPAINSYDLIILGAALNSGPFNLAARGPYWNTAITKPMIITKSTLLSKVRLGYLLDNFEFDSAADASTTARGKLTLLYPDNPVFCGIAHSTVGGNEVMSNFSGIRVASPLNNRGTSVQAFRLLTNDVEHAGVANNTLEPGGVALATLDFNPLDPGVNIPPGQTPTVYPTYKATGYAIAEWPAGTIVRSTQVSGEALASYRLYFGCGTRDASGATTAAPNPLVGALDLTPDGQKMFLSAVSRALSHPLALTSTWGQYDKREIVSGAPGILALSGESAAGFTAAIGENTLDDDGNGTADNPGRPRIYQTFAPQALSKVGQRATLKFKLKFNSAPVVGDTQFRFGFTDTLRNQAVLAMLDIGAPSGDVWRMRPDISITGSGSGTVPGNTLIRSHAAGDWSDFGNTGRADYIIDHTGARVGLVDPVTGLAWTLPRFQVGGTIGSGSTLPNNIGLQDTVTTHSFEFILERVAAGLQWTMNWGNDSGDGSGVASGTRLTAVSAPVADDTYLPMNSVDGLGFMIFNNAPFGAGVTGSFAVSEVFVTAEGAACKVVPKVSVMMLL